jgi:LAGLIDADG endonuclease
MLSPDGPFLAGFVAGEAHFWIRPNNAGQSWACGFELCQRDDNSALVQALRDQVGCGAIRRKAAWRSSRPQVGWIVQSIDGCVRLATVLDGWHLLGKKAGDFRIWREAVAVWRDKRLGRARWPRLDRFASALRAHRRPDVMPDYTWVDIGDPYLEGFLAGFASAEGHFGASVNGHPRFVIKLRADDSAVLALIASRVGVGRLVPISRRGRDRPQLTWLVTELGSLRRLVSLFDRRPPLGRAGRLYPYWRELVTRPVRDGTVLRSLARDIRSMRRYRVPEPLPTARSRMAARREQYVSALEQWAREAGPPYTATSYQRWRRTCAEGAPTRNTLASSFGSWRGALQAAGIPTVDSRPAGLNRVSRDRAVRSRVGKAVQVRRSVLLALQRCSVALGTVPTATEFLRWRLQAAPGVPSQATIYRYFPGGWESVLQAADGLAGSVAPEHSEAGPQPLHVGAPAREQLAGEPDVQAGAADQLGHEGVAGDEVAAG